VRLDEPGAPADVIASTVRNALRDVIRFGVDADEPEPSQINIVLTDGARMIATRWNNSLYYIDREGVRDCEICGTPHANKSANGSYCATVVASEPLTNESWIPVPNGTVVVVDVPGSAHISSL
jgi:predicted glutamine amidotransferase